jgi:hypothetical protein
MLDPINLAKAELATLEKEATLIVSYGHATTAKPRSPSRALIALRSSTTSRATTMASPEFTATSRVLALSM